MRLPPPLQTMDHRRLQPPNLVGEAVEDALAFRPELITSDVKLIGGTGPRAVEHICRRLGHVPVIFISATPDECKPCDPPGVVSGKPLREQALKDAFRQIL